MTNEYDETATSRAALAETVSHELRTPLTSIIGYIEMLASEDLGPVSDDQRVAIDAIRCSAHRIARFVMNHEGCLTLANSVAIQESGTVSDHTCVTGE